MAATEYPARIRLTEREAQFLVAILDRERALVTEARMTAKESGKPTTMYNRATAIIDGIVRELELLADQKEWDLDGEPLVEDEEGAGSSAPA